MVIGSDTAVWNAPGGIAVANYRNRFDPALFTSPETNAFKTIDPGFRGQFLDSFGQRLKMSWWLLVGSVYGQSENIDVPVPNLMPLYLMQKYHGETLRQLGDEVTLHYHTFLWSDYNGDGIFYWNEAETFHECRADWDLALAQSLIEEEVFPVSFRSGWHYMDNEWQQYLNELLPYNMDNDSPNFKVWSTNEPTFNVLDWSHASTEFVPFQPSVTNYQTAGTGPSWNVRSVKFPNVTQALIDRTFDQAAAGVDQVVSLWGHLAESDFVTNIARMHAFIQVSASAHRDVKFRYCTAVEAMQRWLGKMGGSPPVLTIDQQVDGDVLTLRIASDKSLFQPRPFVAVKDLFQRYSLASCEAIGSNDWSAKITVPLSQLAKIGIAATDQAGNLTTRILRFVPDDMYLDNLDPQYHELTGTWTNSPVVAWGTNSRVALLRSNETAQVSWDLPVSATAEYSLLAQFPNIAKLSTNVDFTLKSNDASLVTIERVEVIPGKWIYLGKALLQANTNSSLVMTVRGDNSAESFAAADVIRLTPLPVQTPDALTEVVVDPGDTTANILWNTRDLASGFIKYGPQATFGRFSVTNTVPARNHVATLSGLIPGTAYRFQIENNTLGLQVTYEGTFKTKAGATSPVLNMLAERGAVTLFWNGLETPSGTTNRVGNLADQHHQPAFDPGNEQRVLSIGGIN
jgi:hypothetical protein